MCTLHDFSVLKSNLCIRALLLDRILATEKTTRTPLVHLVSSFFCYEKNYLMLSLAMSVRPSVRLSVRPSSVEISLERGSKRSAKPIDLKIGLDMDN